MYIEAINEEGDKKTLFNNVGSTIYIQSADGQWFRLMDCTDGSVKLVKQHFKRRQDERQD